MKTRVALCVNKNIGLKITKFLKSHEGTEICLLYLAGENKSHDCKIIKASGVKNKNIFRGNEIYKTEKHINFFKRFSLYMFIIGSMFFLLVYFNAEKIILLVFGKNYFDSI